MTGRKTLDQMTSDELDELHDQLDRLRQDLAQQAQEMATWRAMANALDAGTPGTPRDRAARAEAAVERVSTECDRIEAAVRANPQAPDFDGAYLAAIGHIRTALDEPAPAATATQATDTAPIVDRPFRSHRQPKEQP